MGRFLFSLFCKGANAKLLSFDLVHIRSMPSSQNRSGPNVLYLVIALAFQAHRQGSRVVWTVRNFD